MYKKLFTILIATAAFAGCNGGKAQDEPKGAAPVVVSTTPEDNATGVEYNPATIVISYDQNIKCTQSNQKKITVKPSGTITSVSAYHKDLTLTIDNLEAETEYTVTVPTKTVYGFAADQGAAEVKITFTTKKNSAPIVNPDSDKIPEPGTDLAWTMAAKLGLGWNMGNHFDAFYNGTWAGDKLFWPDETCWGNPKCTKDTFTGLYKAGFRSIRIPITWLNTIGPAPEYKIDEKWMGRIVEVVGWARDAGLQVIINTHHDEDHYYGNESSGHRWLNIIGATESEETNRQVIEQIKGVWTNIANTFKSEGDYLIFESFNEINDGRWGNSPSTERQCAVLDQWNQAFVDAVRATGGNNATRWISVPTYAANPSMIKWFTMPEDPAERIMLAVHCYDPYNYTLAEGLPQKQWGHNLNNSNDEKQIRAVFASLYSNYIAKGIPVYMGEFGCSMREYNTAEWRSYKYYLEYFVKCSKSFGLPCFLWDNGNEGAGSEHHAYINHGTGNYIGHSKELVDVMVNAMYNTNSNYTLDTVYNSAPKS